MIRNISLRGRQAEGLKCGQCPGWREIYQVPITRENKIVVDDLEPKGNRWKRRIYGELVAMVGRWDDERRMWSYQAEVINKTINILTLITDNYEERFVQLWHP